ncbi:MAG: HNH endonuclease, partial [Halobacteriovoraceae bacterium]|nr:HNH endonuclease [Halobacteriovoraceae bacterium]
KLRESAFFFTAIDASFERVEEEILRKVFQQKRRFHQSQKGRIKKRGRRWKWFKKDNTCGLCGTKIEHYYQSSLDHIVPVSRGGSNSITNLRLTHIRCNRIKGDRLDEELGQEFLTF